MINTKTDPIWTNTLAYIENFLTPEKDWDKSISTSMRMSLICSRNVDWEFLSSHIRSMDYQSFLKTLYWKEVAQTSKKRAGYRCQVCNSREQLAVHHRSYRIHGFEHAHLNELTVLCKACHSCFHNKKREGISDFQFFLIALVTLAIGSTMLLKLHLFL